MAKLMRIDVERFVAAGKPFPTRSRRLLDTVLALATADEAPVVSAEALRAQISEQSGLPISEAAFRQQLKRLNDGLKKRRAPFQLASRDKLIAVEANAFWDVEASTASLRQTLQEHSGEKVRGDLEGLVPPRALPEQLHVMFSYAWIEGSQQEIQVQFFDRLKAELSRPPERYAHLPRIELWRDKERLSRSDLGIPQMDEACTRAFLGILMISTKYPHSKACVREANFFLDEAGNNRRGKRCIVVQVNCALDEIPQRFKKDSRIVIAGPQGQHLLRHWTSGTEADRQDLVRALALEVFESAEDWCRAGPPPTPPPRSMPHQPVHKTTRDFFTARSGALPHDEGHSVRPRARPGPAGYSLADIAEIDEAGGLQIVDHLVAWSRSDSPKRPRLAALLGDFGMGKTVTCQLVTRRLLDLAEAGEKVPVPIYFDLRDVHRPSSETALTLENLIDQMLERVEAHAPSPEDVIRFARDEKALVIFDGLDEITNKLKPDDAKRVYRQLLSIVPTSVWNEDARRRRFNQKGINGPSILISCRSQYFADFAAERSFLTDSDRSGLDPRADMSAYIMLPFTGDQVREYLAKNLSPPDGRSALSLIGDTYDLGELAKRPILLRYIGEMVHRLEEEKLAGNRINISRLYHIIVEQAFQRDDPKHVIRIFDKRRILQALALHLHKLGQDEISNERLTEWLDEEIERNHPLLARSLATSEGLSQSQIFLQDLRNATLLSRPGESGFRFGHTSMKEYFLAEGLYKAARRDDSASLWSIPSPSEETLNFVLRRHEIAETIERSEFEDAFPRLLEPGAPLEARWLAFRIWRRSIEEQEGLPRPARIDCSGFDVSRMTFAGSRQHRMPLWGSDWSNASLRQTEFRDVDLRGSTFRAADATAAVFVRCALERATFDDAKIGATCWRETAVEPAVIRATSGSKIEVHNSTAGNNKWEADPFPENCTGKQYQRRMAAYGLNTIGFADLDGVRRMITASSAGIIRLWEVESGAPARTMDGHTYGVRSVNAGVLKGHFAVVAGAADGSLRLWNFKTGELLGVLQGHERIVTSLEFSFDDEKSRLVSASEDGEIIVRETAGAVIIKRMRMKGKNPKIITIARNARTPIAASGNTDGDIDIWDVETGCKLQSLSAGAGVITSIDLLEYNNHLVVAASSMDGTLIVFSVATGSTMMHISVEAHHSSRVRLTELDGRLALVHSTPDVARIFDLDRGTAIREFNFPRRDHSCFGLSTAFNVFVSGSYSGEVLSWDLQSGRIMFSSAAASEWINSLSTVLRDDRLIVGVGGFKGSVTFFDAETGERVRKAVEKHGLSTSVLSTTFEGRPAFAFARRDGAVVFEDGITNKEIAVIEGAFRGVALALDTTGKSPMLIASGFKQGIHLWDLPSANSKGTLGKDDNYYSVISTVKRRNQRLLAAANTAFIQIWDLDKRELISTVEPASKDVNAISFATANGSVVLMSASEDGELGMWDLDTGNMISSFKDPRSPLKSLACGILSNRSIAALGGADGSLRLIDLETHEIMFDRILHDDWVRTLAVTQTADAIVVASGSDDGTVRISKFDPAFSKLKSSLIRFPEIDAGLDLTTDFAGKEILCAVQYDAWRAWYAECRAGETSITGGIEQICSSIH